jgi:hypothetical protein
LELELPVPLELLDLLSFDEGFGDRTLLVLELELPVALQLLDLLSFDECLRGGRLLVLELLLLLGLADLLFFISDMVEYTAARCTTLISSSSDTAASPRLLLIIRPIGTISKLIGRCTGNGNAGVTVGFSSHLLIQSSRLN